MVWFMYLKSILKLVLPMPQSLKDMGLFNSYYEARNTMSFGSGYATIYIIYKSSIHIFTKCILGIVVAVLILYVLSRCNYVYTEEEAAQIQEAGGSVKIVNKMAIIEQLVWPIFFTIAGFWLVEQT